MLNFYLDDVANCMVMLHTLALMLFLHTPLLLRYIYLSILHKLAETREHDLNCVMEYEHYVIVLMLLSLSSLLENIRKPIHTRSGQFYSAPYSQSLLIYKLSFCINRGTL